MPDTSPDPLAEPTAEVSSPQTPQPESAPEPTSGSKALRQSHNRRSSIAHLLGFIAPYRWRWIGAIVALLITAGITLSLGQGVRIIIDEGFVAGNVDQLRHGVFLLLTLSVFMALGTFCRFYLVSWLGERVSADIRTAVFNNVVELSPGYFDNTRSGEIMSRLTTDTTLLQTLVGSSFSLALRSSISMTGAAVFLVQRQPSTNKLD